MMGFNQQPGANNSLNLSMTGAPASMGGYMPTSNNWYAQQPQQPSLMASFLGSAAGMDPQYAQNGMMPPSDTEILMTMLNTQLPVQRFVQSNTFNMVLDILGQMMTFSFLNVLKDASFNFDDEHGVFKLDVTSLPAHLQTMSPENIMAQMSGLQNDVNATISNADTVRMQTMQRASVFSHHSSSDCRNCVFRFSRESASRRRIGMQRVKGKALRESPTQPDSCWKNLSA